MILNTIGAAERLLANATVIPDSCLYYVSDAIFGPYRKDGVVAITPAEHADEVWTYSTQRHADTNAPQGMPVVFARANPDGSRDVGISIGGGLAAFTDYPVKGRTGIASIDERAKQIKNQYLGWTGDYLGWDLLKEKRNSMTTGYSKIDKGVTTWAIAGDGQGEAAWLETNDKGHAQSLEAIHGPFAPLTVASFDLRKRQYLSGGVTIGNVKVDMTETNKKLDLLLAAINRLNPPG